MRFVLPLLILPFVLAAQTPTISYKLGMSKPWTHLFEVELTYSNLPAKKNTLDLALPAWRSGRYLIFDLAGNVIEFTAVDAADRQLPWAKVDKSTWRIEKKGATTVKARYTVFSNDFRARKNGLNDEHAFVNGAAVFMYAEQYRRVPVSLRVLPYDGWRVSTGLESIQGDPYHFSAMSYDHLLDCPLEVGNQKEYEFDVDGMKHVLSIFGEGNFRPDSLTRDIGRIVKAQKEFWGGLPYKRYVFLVHVSPQSAGATEDLNSTVLGKRPFIFHNLGSYRGFLGLVSHEFFHAWNVKRLRPKGMHPYDYAKENYAKEYWIAEGMTSYFSAFMMIRAGLASGSSYAENLANLIQEDRQRPGNKVQSLSESSFDAWIKQWKQGDHAYNTQSDYYGKGSIVSLLLDLEIRQQSKNKHSLGDVLRAMYSRFPITGAGYTIDDFQKVAEEFAGASLREFFADYVHGTKPLDWERFLSYAGLDVMVRNSERRPWTGFSTVDQDETTRITRVVAGSPAYEAGIDIGDEVVALNGYRVRTYDLLERIGMLQPGDKVKILVFREDRIREFTVTLQLQTVPPYRVNKTENPTKLQKEIYESWLMTSWE